jgi:hypothetical protein
MLRLLNARSATADKSNRVANFFERIIFFRFPGNPSIWTVGLTMFRMDLYFPPFHASGLRRKWRVGGVGVGSSLA